MRKKERERETVRIRKRRKNAESKNERIKPCLNNCVQLLSYIDCCFGSSFYDVANTIHLSDFSLFSLSLPMKEII